MTQERAAPAHPPAPGPKPQLQYAEGINQWVWFPPGM